MSPGVPEISVVIPVFDEEEIVATACRDLMAALDDRGWDYELLLSENGSRDRTAEILEELSRAHPRLRYIRSGEPNYGRALKQGIAEARGRWVVADEIDLCDPTFYDRALPMLARGEADMVVGSKRARGSVDARPIFRRVATWVHNTLLRFALGFHGTDTHGVKAFSREQIAPVSSRCVVDRDVFASELVLRAGLEGRRVLEIPIELHEKRPPSIGLLRRVPNVLRQVGHLFWVLRVSAPVRPEAGSAPRAGA
jgi:glycosyltransferase involved in cell wall biosynthesis